MLQRDKFDVFLRHSTVAKNFSGLKKSCYPRLSQRHPKPDVDLWTADVNDYASRFPIAALCLAMNLACSLSCSLTTRLAHSFADITEGIFIDHRP